MYTLPTMGGLTARVAVTQRSKDPNATNDVESTGGSIVYSAGPLMLGAAFNNQNTWTSATAKTKGEEMIIGGSYMINKQLSIQFQHGSVQTDGVKTYKGNQLGARFDVNPSLRLIGTVGSGDGVGRDLKSAFNVGVINSLSKRTRLYALYGADELNTISGSTVTKRERSEFAIGINHAF
jgi:predicted porin